MCVSVCATHQLMTETNLCPCLDRPVGESSSRSLMAGFLLFQVEPQTVAEVRQRRQPPEPTAASCPASAVPPELNIINTSSKTQP